MTLDISTLYAAAGFPARPLVWLPLSGTSPDVRAVLITP